MAFASLTIDLNAKIASFEADLKRMEAQSRTTAQRMESAFAGVGKAFGVLGGAALVGSFAAFAREAVSSAAALDDMAEATGASVEGLSRLTQIARIGGQDVGVIETALVRLTKALAGSDEESKGAAAAFRAIGLSVSDLKTQAPDQALRTVATALNAFEDGAGKTATALEIFGKSGAQLLPLLKDIATEGERGASVTAEQAAAAEELEKKWARLTVTAANFGRSLVLDVVAPLQYLDKRSTEVTVFDRLANSFNSLIVAFESKRATFFEFLGMTGAAGRARKEAGSAAAAMDAQATARVLAQLEQFPADFSEGKPSLPIPTPAAKTSKAAAVKRQDTMLDIFAKGSAKFEDPFKDFDESQRKMREDLLQLVDPARKAAQELRAFEDVAPSLGLAADEVQRIREELIDRAAAAEWGAPLKDIKEQAEPLKGLFSDLESAIGGWARSSADALASFAITGKASFSDFATSVINDLARMAIYQTVTKPLFGVLQSFLPSFLPAGAGGGALPGGGFFSAKGNVFDSSGWVPFARGGVVDRPTLFPFARGIGLMGEAGPEAILPLKRGADGKLGVAGGAGGGMVVHIHEAPGTRATAQQGQDQDGTPTLDIIIEQIEATQSRRIAKGQGLAPVFERRYGLSPAPGLVR